MRTLHAALLLALPLLLTMPVRTLKAASAPKVIERPCANAPKGEAWRCLSVAADDGFPISVLVAPALRPNPARRAVFVVEGMDESGVEAAADGLIETLSALRADRDVVVMDQRGSGGAFALTCPAAEAPGGDPMSPARAEACRRSSAAKLDLAKVSSRTAVSDLERSRAALGYSRIELLGFFQGARVAQLYALAFSSRLEAVALLDPAPPGQSMPAALAENAPRALDLVVADCLADGACAAAYPRLAAERTAVFARLETQSLRSGATVVTGDLAAAWLGGLAMRLGTAANVPALIHALAAGQDDAIARRVLAGQKALAASYPLGARLAIECGEDLPAKAPAAAVWSARRLAAETAACADWPHPLDRKSGSPRGGRVPILILSGEAEPTVRLAALAAMTRGLPGSRLVILRGRARAVDSDWDQCVGPMTTRFLTASGLGPLDDSCPGRLKRPPFKVTPLAAV